MKTLTTQSFEVDYVTPASSPSPTTDYRTAISRAIGGKEIESCSPGLLKHIAQGGGDGAFGTPIEVHHNQLFATLIRCYAEHRPITFSPDMIWLLMLQGVSNHINTDPEKYRDLLVNHDGTKPLAISRPDFVPGIMENDWETVWPELVGIMESKLKAPELIPNFSTTGTTERAAFNITVMETMKHFYEYWVGCVCGIPTVTLEGTTDDWDDLCARADNLRRFDLGWWIDKAMPVLEGIKQAANGTINREWWQSFFYYPARYGGNALSGHVVKLFPYTVTPSNGPKGNQKQSLRKSYCIDADFSRPDNHADPERWRDMSVTTHGLSNIDVPPAMSRVPFTMVTKAKEQLSYEAVAGFIGATNTEDNGLRPEIAWGVRQVR